MATFEPDHWHLLPDGREVDLLALMEGRVFTHRLTEDERRRDALVVEPDLDPLLFSFDDRVPLAAGGEAEIVVPGIDQLDAQILLVGPAGWLAAHEAGGLVGVGLRDGRLTLTALSADPEAERLARMLAESFGACVEDPETDGTFLIDVVAHRLDEDPSALRAPAPPLGELLDAAGLERRGDQVGHAGRDWELPGMRAWRERRAFFTDQYGFDRCCYLAFLTVEAALGSGDAPTEEVVEALAHGAVAEALVGEVIAARGGEEAAEALVGLAAGLAPIARGRARGAVRYLEGAGHEAAGDSPRAEEAMRAALAADPGFSPALSELAGYTEDRGDTAAAIALLRRAGAEGDDPDLERLIRHAAASEGARVGRNAPCPCGSGRKHKACCLGRPAPLDDRTGWLYEKALAFAHRRESREWLVDLAEELAGGEDPDPEALLLALGEPLVADIALFECGLLAQFLAARGPLLPADERELAERWLSCPRALFEIAEVASGEGLALRDTRTGAATRVRERLGSTGREPGELLLARVVPGGTTHQLVGPVLEVPLARREGLLELTGRPEPPDAEEWIAWLRSLRALPRMRTSEGDELLFCRATYRVLDPTVARARLAEVLEADPEGGSLAWGERGGEAGLVRGVVHVEGDELRLETVSAERLRGLMAIVAQAVPDAALVEEHRETLAEALARRAEADEEPEAAEEPPPELRRFLAEHMERYAERWVDEPIPALGGLTPRQARDDPTRREDLMALLRESERLEEAAAESGGAAMPVARIRALLGLER